MLVDPAFRGGNPLALTTKDMYTIDRSIAIIRPQLPFVDWANQLPDADQKVSLEDFQEDCLAVLIAEYNSPKEAKEHINNMWQAIFEESLWGWCTEESWWPKARTKKMFWEWFKVDFHSVVLDPYEDPIEKEEL